MSIIFVLTHLCIKYYQTVCPLFSLCQVVSSATHRSPSGTTSLIDLAFVPSLSQVSSCSVVPPLANFDHYGLQLEIAKPTITVQKQTKLRIVWRYALADFEKANEMIDSIDWDPLITEDVNISLANWKKAFMNIMDECIPRVILPKKQNLPWMSKK